MGDQSDDPASPFCSPQPRPGFGAPNLALGCPRSRGARLLLSSCLASAGRWWFPCWSLPTGRRGSRRATGPLRPAPLACRIGITGPSAATRNPGRRTGSLSHDPRCRGVFPVGRIPDARPAGAQHLPRLAIARLLASLPSAKPSSPRRVPVRFYGVVQRSNHANPWVRRNASAKHNQTLGFIYVRAGNG
jgi:hypothetical protein